MQTKLCLKKLHEEKNIQVAVVEFEGKQVGLLNVCHLPLKDLDVKSEVYPYSFKSPLLLKIRPDGPHFL